MTFDLFSIWTVGALSQITIGLLMLAVRNQYPDRLNRTLLFMGAANLCLGASFAFGAVRGRTGEFQSQVLFTTMVTFCFSLEYRAVAELKRLRPSKVWFLAPPSLVFALSIWLTFVQRNITLKQMLFNLINLAVMVLVTRCLAHPEDGRRPFADKLAAGAFAMAAASTTGVVLSFLRSGNFAAEYDMSQPRSIYNLLVATTLSGGVSVLFVFMVSERLNHDLKFLAMRDSLTGLYNRRAFEEIAAAELSGTVRTGLPLAVLMIDIDHFKQFNDEFGHVAGDAALVIVASTLRRSLRDEDFLCRWGGDEFCALLPRANSEQAEIAAKRILLGCEELHLLFEGRRIEIRVSAGAAIKTETVKDLSSLVERADMAMYRAKRGQTGFALAPDAG